MNQTCIPVVNPTWLWYIILFIHDWISFVKVCGGYSWNLYPGRIWVCSFFKCSLCIVWCQDNSAFIKWIGKCSHSFHPCYFLWMFGKSTQRNNLVLEFCFFWQEGGDFNSTHLFNLMIICAFVWSISSWLCFGSLWFLRIGQFLLRFQIKWTWIYF